MMGGQDLKTAGSKEVKTIASKYYSRIEKDCR